MSSTTPLVSIVIPCYNAEPFVRQAIQSSLNQFYPNKEVIVIDDGSTDGSLDIIRSFGDHIRWETGPNRGACAARNRGLELASGELVKFLDADDWLTNDCLERQVPNAMKYSEDDKNIVFGHFREIDNIRESEEAWCHPIWKEISEGYVADLGFLLIYGVGGVAGPLHKKNYVKKLGGFNINLQRGQEYDLHLRMYIDGAKFLFQNAQIYFCRHHQSQSRITNRWYLSKDGFTSMFSIYDNIAYHMQEDSSLRAESIHLARCYYNLARLAYSHDQAEVAQEALSKARALGLKGHHGTIAHRIASSILGLKTKAILSDRLHKLTR